MAVFGKAGFVPALFRAFVIASLVSLAGIASAQAQNYDRLVGISDDNVDGVDYDPSPAGGQIEYLFEVANIGPGTAPGNTVLQIEVPANATLDTTRGDLTCTLVNPSLLECPLPAIPLNESVSVIARFTAPEQGVVRVVARVPDVPDGGFQDVEPDNSDPTDFEISETTTIEAGADLQLTLDLPASAQSGEEITFTYTLTNNGPDSSSSSQFEVPIPTGLADVTLPAGCTLSGTTATCDNALLANGASQDFAFTGVVSVASGSTIEATGGITDSTPGDPITINNVTSGRLDVDPGTDLTVDLTRSPGGNVLTGEPVTFTVAPSYSGEEPSDISFTFDVPPEFEVAAAPTPVGWTCTLDGAVGAQTVTCTRPDGGGAGAGADIPLGTIDIEAVAIAEGVAIASVTISADDPQDSEPGNNTDSLSIQVEAPSVDLDVSKVGPSPALAVVGEQVEYDLGARNIGNAVYEGRAILEDRFPAGLTLASFDAAPGLVCSLTDGGPAIDQGVDLPLVGPAEIFCSVDYPAGSGLAPGGALPGVELTFDVTAAGSLSNTGEVEIDPLDPTVVDVDQSNDVTTPGLTAATGPNTVDLRPVKTDQSPAGNFPGPVEVGEIQTFRVDINNDGPADVTAPGDGSPGLRLVDTLTSLLNTRNTGADAGVPDVRVVDPGGAAGLRANGTFGNGCNLQGASGANVTLVCSFNSLAVCGGGGGQPACPYVEIDIRPGRDGTSRENTASLTSLSVPEADRGNNTSTAPYTVTERADITVEKNATPSSPRAGQDLVYAIAARNRAGYSTAQDVELVDVLPAGLRIISIVTPAGVTCTSPFSVGDTTGGGAASRTLTCDMGALAQNQQRTVRVTAKPVNDVIGDTLVNDADVTTTTPEADLTNNDDDASVVVRPPVLDLLVNKRDNADPVLIGDRITYTVVVQNANGSDSQNVTAIDYLPPSNLTFVEVLSPDADGSCSGPLAPDPASPFPTRERAVCTWPLVAASNSSTPGGNRRRMVVRFDVIAKGTVRNEAAITSDEIQESIYVGGVSSENDRLEGNNTASENTTIRTRAELAATAKTARDDSAGFPVIAAVVPEQDFFFDLTFEVRNGPGLAEADDVVLTDLLPSGVSVRGPPAAAVVTGGTIARQDCAITTVGAREQLRCEFGTVAPVPLTNTDDGSAVSVTIRLPVEIASGTDGASFANTFDVTTSSLDDDPDNNDASETVTLATSSIAGSVYRDFNDDGDQDAGDTELTGVEIVLTGTTVDGVDVEIRQTIPGGGGGYLFDNLAPGTYTVTRGTVTGDRLEDGRAVPGSGDGSADGPTVIQTITVPADSALVDYDFTVVPQARIGLSKRVVGTPTVSADGSVVTNFALIVRNTSEEPVTVTSVTDRLSGAAPFFGTLGTAGDLDPGEYAVTGAPGGTCGGRNAGFNGQGDTVLASAFGLPSISNCTITVQVTTQPTIPLPDPQPGGEIYRNQAVIEATGDLSGQDSSTNPDLSDLSDDGPNPNPAGSPADTDAPTPVPVTFPTPAISLVKTVDTSAVSTPPAEGDVLTYAFRVTNEGPTTLTDVTVTDTSLPGIALSGGPIASLAPGAFDDTTYTATYVLTQDDVNANRVENSADVIGDDPYGGEATDDSGTMADNDNPTVAILTEEPGIALVKTADASALSDPPAVGDVITYRFAVFNTGNVTLSDVTVTDPRVTVTGGPITLPRDGEDTTTFSGLYTLTQADIDAGETVNTAIVTSTTQAGGTPTDTSGTDQENDDPTVVPLSIAPDISLEKTVDTSALSVPPVPGEELTYSFAVTNSGNVTLTDVRVIDPLPGLVLTGDPIPTLLPGETDDTTYTGTYAITQEDIDGRQLRNRARAVGTFQDGDGGTGTVRDTDVAVADLQAIEANPEPYPPFATDGGTTTTVLASDLLNGETPTLDTVTIRVIETDAGVTLDPETGLITLAPGQPAGSYEVTYEICSIEAPALCAETTETVVQLPLPAIEATKMQEVVDVDGSGTDTVGDRVDYTITVENTGNVALDDVRIEDTLTNRLGQPLSLSSGPTFVSASQGSPEGALEIGEMATYVASRVVDDEVAAGRGLSNEVVAFGTDRPIPGVPPAEGPVTDKSDDGEDGDGNVLDDATVFVLDTPGDVDSGLRLTKTTRRDIVRRGEVVPYTLVITNINEDRAGPVDLRDRLPDGFVYVPDTATLDGEPADVVVSDNSHVVTFRDIFVPGEGSVTATLAARVLNVVDVGEHTNVAQVRDPVTGGGLTPTASATVRLLPEPAFDCGEVIGKVFNDIDGDGHQDPTGGRENPGISNQDYGGKGGKAQVPDVPRTETGIPSVRLVTVDGLVITTDQHGRFSVPCAALPLDRGSNFLLKLDERTLPTGWRVTTENPRVMRLTPGMMTEMNFGATLGRVVRVDLNAAAFDGRDPVPALLAGMETLVAQLDRQPTVVRFAYHVAAGADAAQVGEAYAQMRQAERRLGRIWRGDGRGPLRVETTIVRPGQ